MNGKGAVHRVFWVSCLLLVALGSIGFNGMGDFRVLYYGARTLLAHHDPYLPSEVERVYQAGAGERAQPDPIAPSQDPVIALNVYFPNVYLFTAPLAALPWSAAHLLWMILVDASLILAAWLMLHRAGEKTVALEGGLACLVILSSLTLPLLGNVAALVVCLCVVAVVAFMADRFAVLGAFCLAAALILKPQNAGPVWLYFLLAGGVYRKRAGQTLALFLLLSVPGVLWTMQTAPHWASELSSNLSVAAAHGGQSDPTPTATSNGSAAMLTSLQTVYSFFWSDPQRYNLATCLTCAPLLLAWAWTVLRSRVTAQNTWLALAAISALSLLPVYHRPHDAKIMLLAIPACGLLWTAGGRSRWPALVLTAGSILLNSELLIHFLVEWTRSLALAQEELSGKLLTILLARPAPLILLLTGAFYLGIYIRKAARPAQG